MNAQNEVQMLNGLYIVYETILDNGVWIGVYLIRGGIAQNLHWKLGQQVPSVEAII